MKLRSFSFHGSMFQGLGGSSVAFMGDVHKQLAWHAFFLEVHRLSMALNHFCHAKVGERLLSRSCLNHHSLPSMARVEHWCFHGNAFTISQDQSSVGDRRIFT